MLDLDLCKQCAKDDGKGYWLTWTSEIMWNFRLKKFALGSKIENIRFTGVTH